MISHYLSIAGVALLTSPLIFIMFAILVADFLNAPWYGRVVLGFIVLGLYCVVAAMVLS